MFYIQKRFAENRAVYDITLKNTIDLQGRAAEAAGDNTLRRMRIACLINKDTKKHTEYVMVSIAYPQQKV